MLNYFIGLQYSDCLKLSEKSHDMRSAILRSLHLVPMYVPLDKVVFTFTTSFHLSSDTNLGFGRIATNEIPLYLS